jgi:hypothetical protein
MLTIDQTVLEADDADTQPACVALVPVTEAPQRASAIHQVSRPDPSFVTHLIATAEHLPQTRNLRRAAPSVALSAYTARLRPAQGIGGQTRQVA